MDLVSLLSSTTSKGNPNAWDISKAYYDVGADAWDISTAYYVQVFSVAAQDTSPQGVFFKPDGTKMYVVGYAGSDINEYTLSKPWVVSSASYVRVFSVGSQPRGVFFKPDGTKMYVISSASDDVNEYSLSSAWNISTASYVQNFSVAAQETVPNSVFFKPDGTTMFIVGSASDRVIEYSLSSAWDISTASFVQDRSVTAEETLPTGLFFKADGTKMYIIGETGVDVNEYNLSTPWDISTETFVQNFSVSSQETVPQGIFFHPDGIVFYIIGEQGDDVSQYTLGGFSVATEELTPQGLFFKPDGTKMYIVGSTGDDVNEYTLSTPWLLSSATYSQNFSVATEEATPSSLFFKPDGTKMYVLGNSGGDVNEYDLSSAWDISTASYVQNFSVSAQETAPNGLFFNPDGLKMYVTGNVGDDVNEYDLSSAWDVSTASYLQNFSVSAQSSFPSGIFFKPDGTKMYMLARTEETLSEYNLSAEWDVSTASYVQNFSAGTQASLPQDIFFKPDGTQFWIVDSLADKVFSYSISPT